MCSKDSFPDGFLKTGNVDVDMDLSGYPDNGNSTELYNFLKIPLEDGFTIYQHLVKDTDYIKKQFKVTNIEYKKIKSSLLPKTKDSNITSERLKQVYFPVDGNYHLLSALTPSGIIYKLKQRINSIRFSDENKAVREALSKHTAIKGKIEDIKNLTAMGYGGNNAQNVSVLNNQNGGVSLLLSSLPPQLTKRKTQPPKTNFFESCLWANLFKENFAEFHKILVWRKNNIAIRDKRDGVVLNSIFKVQRVINNIRDAGIGWSESETYAGLEHWQKIWLDDQYQDIRDDSKQNQDYLKQAQSGFANLVYRAL